MSIKVVPLLVTGCTAFQILTSAKIQRAAIMKLKYAAIFLGISSVLVVRGTKTMGKEQVAVLK
jgi:hypothetical protein